MRNNLKQSQRIVVKAGTSVLSAGSGRISQASLRKLGKQLLLLRKQKKEVSLVTSGSIAFGMEACGYKNRPKEMAKLQACAAIGQQRLMRAYEQFFLPSRIKTAQLLLTRDGLEMRKRFLSARKTLNELLRMKVLPIINENDTVSSEEIAFGDNDILSVHVAHLMNADLLIILSDVDGFYLKDGSRIREVPSTLDIDRELVKHLKDTKKEKTVGGMRAKLEAARVAMRLGVSLLIVNGHDAQVIQKALNGEDVGTLFYGQGSQKNARKQWIAYSAARKGKLILDQGACEALDKNKSSLLASGIQKVSGQFLKGDVVELLTSDQKVIGRGISRYSTADLQKIKGKKTKDIKAVLGSRFESEVINRNDLLIWD